MVTFYDHFDVNEWETIEELKEEGPVELTGIGKCLFENELYLAIASCWANTNEYDNVQLILKSAIKSVKVFTPLL